MSDGTRLPALARIAEEATQAFVDALDAESAAFEDERRAYHSAYARCEPDASAASKKAVSEQAAFEEKIVLHHAENAVVSARAKRDKALAILSAAQSHLRAVEKQT